MPAYASGPIPRVPDRPARARTARFWLGVVAAIGVGATAIGVLVGYLAFGGDDDAQPTASIAGRADDASSAKVVDGEPGAAIQPAASAVGAGARTGTALDPGAAEVRVTRIEHPVVAAAVAATDGEVERIHVKAGGSVTTGQKLYTLRAGRGVRAAEAVVSAPAAGRIERRAARGDHVEKGDVLAQLVDPALWLVVADLSSDNVTTAWSCTVSTAEGRNRAPCRVESVQRLGGQNSRATASVASDVALWLQGGGQELLLKLTPPTVNQTANPTPAPAAGTATAGTATAGTDQPAPAGTAGTAPPAPAGTADTGEPARARQAPASPTPPPSRTPGPDAAP
ncbi:MAG TPA: biotin/lipoyl-containing protein [Kofleriaceae bacterium]|nr:biotin/lipoyl-containing protein [Kofleriaceae bacterium]